MNAPIIDYGDRKRLGVMVPSGNSVAEPELRAMLPSGISLLVTRLRLTGSSEAELLGMLDGLETAASLLADARVDRIAFHCTAVSTFLPTMAGEIRARVEGRTGIGSLATADAILEALAALKVRRVVLVTPYIEAVHAREIGFLRAHGIAVVGGACMGIAGNDEMSRLLPGTIAELAQRCCAEAPESDACFISCTAIRSAGLIAPLEQALGIPVITSNQVLAWHALRRMGVDDPVEGFGRLFSV
jgi:maleate cis-trans isomerase